MCQFIRFYNNLIFLLEGVFLKYLNLEIKVLERKEFSLEKQMNHWCIQHFDTFSSIQIFQSKNQEHQIIRFWCEHIEYFNTSMHVTPSKFMIKLVESFPFMGMFHNGHYSTLNSS